MLKVIQDKVDALATSALSESNKQVGETGDPDCKIKESEAGDKGASKVSSEEDNNNANIPEGKWYHISGLATNSIFSVGLLHKIINLLRGQIMTPYQG